MSGRSVRIWWIKITGWIADFILDTYKDWQLQIHYFFHPRHPMRQKQLWKSQFESKEVTLPSGMVLHTKEDGHVNSSLGNRIKVKVNDHYLKSKVEAQAWAEELQHRSELRKARENKKKQVEADNYARTLAEYKKNHPRSAFYARRKAKDQLHWIRNLVYGVVIAFMGIVIIMSIIDFTDAFSLGSGHKSDLGISSNHVVIKDYTDDSDKPSTKHNYSSTKKKKRHTQSSDDNKSDEQKDSTPESSERFNVTGTASQLEQPLSNGASLNYGATYHFTSASAASMWATAQEEFWRDQGYKHPHFKSSPQGGIDLTFSK